MGRPPPCTITIARRGCCDAAPGPRSLRVDGMATRRTPAARLQVDIHIGRQYDSAVKIAVKAGVPRRPRELSSKIGRAEGRARVGQDGEIRVVPASLKKKKK